MWDGREVQYKTEAWLCPRPLRRLNLPQISSCHALMTRALLVRYTVTVTLSGPHFLSWLRFYETLRLAAA